jgi:hypothetical protein
MQREYLVELNMKWRGPDGEEHETMHQQWVNASDETQAIRKAEHELHERYSSEYRPNCEQILQIECKRVTLTQ